jgi:hypothetical protein
MNEVPFVREIHSRGDGTIRERRPKSKAEANQVLTEIPIHGIRLASNGIETKKREVKRTARAGGGAGVDPSSPRYGAHAMKRWLTVWLFGLLLSGAGCALSERCRRNVCCHFGNSEPEAQQTVHHPAPNNSTLAPLEMPSPLAVSSPPIEQPTEQVRREPESPFPRRLPEGDPVSQGEIAPPIIVQTQKDSDLAGAGHITKPAASIKQEPMRSHADSSPPSAPAQEFPRSTNAGHIERKMPAQPRFLTPMPLYAEPATFRLPTPAMPAGTEKTKEGVQPIENRTEPEARVVPREPRSDTVRVSHYFPIEPVQSIETREPPLNEKGTPRNNAGSYPGPTKEELRPVFGQAVPAPSEDERPAPWEILRFGLPKNVGKGDEGETTVAAAPHQPYVHVPFTPAQPGKQAAKKTTPNMAWLPVSQTAVRPRVSVSNQVVPNVPVSLPMKRVVLHLEPPTAAAPSIVPFVIVQELPKEAQRPIDVSLLEPVPQTLIYRNVDETTARSPADLGPPETPER